MHDSLITIIFFYLHSRMVVLFTNTTFSAFFLPTDPSFRKIRPLFAPNLTSLLSVPKHELSWIIICNLENLLCQLAWIIRRVIRTNSFGRHFITGKAKID